VRYQPGRTVLTVENGAGPGGAASAAVPGGGLLAGAGGGHGLEAMRVRAQRAGGTARSGPHDGGWLVELEVPA
jgi:signal transduction histidine kinase